MSPPDCPVVSYETWGEADENDKMRRRGSYQLEQAMWHVLQSDHPPSAAWRDPNRAMAFRVLDALRVLAVLSEVP